jgi:hypothetical protein
VRERDRERQRQQYDGVEVQGSRRLKFIMHSVPWMAFRYSEHRKSSERSWQPCLWGWAGFLTRILKQELWNNVNPELEFRRLHSFSHFGGDSPPPFSLCTWLYDRDSQPARLYSQWIILLCKVMSSSCAYFLSLSCKLSSGKGIEVAGLVRCVRRLCTQYAYFLGF